MENAQTSAFYPLHNDDEGATLDGHLHDPWLWVLDPMGLLTATTLMTKQCLLKVGDDTTINASNHQL